MRFLGVHCNRPNSGWLLSYGLKGVSAAMVAKLARFFLACNGGKWICTSIGVIMVQINPTDQKMMSSTKSTNFTSFCKKKQGRETVLQLMWLHRPHPNFKNVSKKYQDTHVIIYSFMHIYLLSYWYHRYFIWFNSCKVVSIKHTDINNINICMQIKNNIFEVPSVIWKIFIN